ncbi:MAG: dockerin type I domain-containing protein [Candidatus Zixiibacteriota bacterium]
MDFRGKRIVLKSEYHAETTIIDCGGSQEASHRAFVLESGEGNETVIEGFTIRNGFARDDLDYPAGGALFCNRTAPTIKNCIFSGNLAAYGGAIACYNGAAPLISYCVFELNSGETAGGAVFCDNSSPVISNSTFARNQAMNIWENRGGGIALVNESQPYIGYNIIAFNNGGGAVYCADFSNPFVVCTDICSNIGGDWDECIAGMNDYLGNFSENPLFKDPSAGNYDLDLDSPCAPVNNSCNALIGARAAVAYICGDADDSGSINLLDITFIIKYLYAGGSAPADPAVMDADGDGSVNILDVIYLIRYIYMEGPAPICT